MSLDKRLQLIVNRAIVRDGRENNPLKVDQDAIEAIKQAFIDDGWMPVPQTAYIRDPKTGHIEGVVKYNPQAYMTGPEWLARFEKEADSCTHYIRSLFREGYPGVTEADHVEMFVKRDIMEAARRAAGVDE